MNEEYMAKNKSSVSKASSYLEMSEYWGKTDSSNFLKNSKSIHFDVEVVSEVTYYPIENSLEEKIRHIARKKGISSDALVNLWLQQKIYEAAPKRKNAP